MQEKNNCECFSDRDFSNIFLTRNSLAGLKAFKEMDIIKKNQLPKR